MRADKGGGPGASIAPCALGIARCRVHRVLPMTPRRSARVNTGATIGAPGIHPAADYPSYNSCPFVSSPRAESSFLTPHRPMEFMSVCLLNLDRSGHVVPADHAAIRPSARTARRRPPSRSDHGRTGRCTVHRASRHGATALPPRQGRVNQSRAQRALVRLPTLPTSQRHSPGLL